MRKPENIFLNQNGYLVTNTRFEVPGQTYVMSGITSVTVMKTVPSKFWPITWLIIGGLFIFFSPFGYASGEWGGLLSALFCGFIFLFLGGIMMLFKKTVYHLILTTAAGEQRATSSTNEAFMQALRAAITNAIIDRG